MLTAICRMQKSTHETKIVKDGGFFFPQLSEQTLPFNLESSVSYGSEGWTLVFVYVGLLGYLVCQIKGFYYMVSKVTLTSNILSHFEPTRVFQSTYPFALGTQRTRKAVQHDRRVHMLSTLKLRTETSAGASAAGFRDRDFACFVHYGVPSTRTVCVAHGRCYRNICRMKHINKPYKTDMLGRRKVADT